MSFSITDKRDFKREVRKIIDDLSCDPCYRGGGDCCNDGRTTLIYGDTAIGSWSANQVNNNNITIPEPEIGNGRVSIALDGEEQGSFTVNQTEDTEIVLPVAAITRDVVHKSGDIMSGDLLGNGSNNLGTSSNKWKTINGINPGTLSLPDKDSMIVLDLTGLVMDGATDNRINATHDGWYAFTFTLAQGLSSTRTVICNESLGNIGHYTFDTAFLNANNTYSVFFPVTKNDTIRIRLQPNTTITCRCYPCIGNI